MSNKPWEGRSVWCSGDKDTTEKGWLEARESDADRVRIIVRPHGLSTREITMTRDEGKTFAALLMNLAVRDRS